MTLVAPRLDSVVQQVAVAGVIAALSLTSDLTRGHPPGEAMRACLLTGELARRAGLSPAARCDAYYASLMRFAGCSATSHEAAAAFGGDDIAVRARGDLIDAARPQEALRFLIGLGSGVDKLRVLARAPMVRAIVAASAAADCEVGAELTHRLRLPDAVGQAVLCAFERFDGKGAPAGRTGLDIPEPARFAAVGFAAAMFAAIGGPELAAETVRRWSARLLDPAVAEIFLDAPSELMSICERRDVWSAVVDAEPPPRRMFDDDAHLDTVLAGFGDAADLKTPYFYGHSRGVAAVARAASGALNIDPTLIYRAGLLHDLGRVAIPTGVWERTGPLSAEEWETVRLHPYHSGRILSRSPALAPVAAVVSRHHERVDGSGYPAALQAGDLAMSSRLLAAADVWRALGEDRPHRRALSMSDAAHLMADLPLDRGAVRAVLQAADAPRAVFPRLPVDLTDRELEVLRLLAAGRTKRQIAAALFVSYSTVHTHTVHIYGKTGVTTRAGLAMFAMQHGLADARP